jgi:hypothetical protein
MDLLATLILAHLIADFPLQTDWIFRLKSRHWAGVLLHAAIHAGVTALLLQNPPRHWPMLVTLGGIHFITDWLKLRVKFKLRSPGFILDQAAHGLALLLLATWPVQMAGILPPIYLYPAVAYATLPALLMLLSVLADDLQEYAVHLPYWPAQKMSQIIPLSQRVGYPLVVLVVIMRLGVWP